MNNNSDKNGRVVMCSLNCNDSNYFLVNLYAPTQDKESEQIDFINYIQTVLEENVEQNTIIGGDFNVCLKSEDKYGLFKRTKANLKLSELIDEYKLLDIWRVYNPNIRRYTWRRRKPLVQSRLDFFLISSELSFEVNNCQIKPSIRTDHSLISLSLSPLKASKRGKGLWKFNASLLSDSIFTEYLKGVIDMKKTEFENINNPCLKWELMKMHLRNYIIGYSKTQSKLRNVYENDLNDEYDSVSEKYDKDPTATLYNRLETLRIDIEKINAIKTEGVKIRSKAIHIEQNEKSSKYFLNLETKNAKISNITKLELEDGNEIVNEKEILKELGSFYENLYTEAKFDETFEKDFLNDNIPSISDADREKCDQILTLNELEDSLTKMKINKSPGSDGFTVEFYRFFWHEIKYLVFQSFQHSYLNGSLSNEQKRGILKLIPKKDKILTKVKNWRPISLLNTDYKLLTHVLATRLQKVLHSIISIDQSGYIKGRNISLNIRTIYDIIEKCEFERISALLVFLDFEKAYDN